MSRLLELRNLIRTSVSLAQTAGTFNTDFTLSTAWFPADEYPNLDESHGLIYIYGRPAESHRRSRNSNLIYEELGISFVILFKSGPDAETESHIAFAESLQDFVRQIAEMNDFVWTSTKPAKDANGLPYAYYEMARGAFCAQFDMTFEVTRNGG